MPRRTHICPCCGKRFYKSNSFLPRCYRATNRLAAKIINDFRQLRSAKSISLEKNVSSQTAKERLALWLYHAKNSHIPEFEACIKTMHNWSEYILNAFDVPYSNGYTEGCNDKTKVLKRGCFGVQNFDTFRNRILHCA